MKKILFMLLPVFILTLGFVGCDKEENNSSQETTLQETKWKLAGFVDEEAGQKRPEPYDSNCYWLYFNSDKTLSGMSSTNELMGEYEFNLQSFTFRFTKLGGTKRGEVFDGNLFVECLNAIQSFSVSNDELRLYYSDKKNHLLFKSTDSHECGIIEIQENEFATMQVSPGKIPLNSANINLMITNQTSTTFFCEHSYSIDKFDNGTWISVYSYHEPTYIGLRPVPTKESVEIPVNLETEQYSYKIGIYRINCQIYLNGRDYDICAEFEMVKEML
jgi:heat shock protein HslJ